MKVNFEQLWAIANREAQPISETFNEAFVSIGLRLEIPTKPKGYYCTPLNVKTFAGTGCDGVHFSFLEMDDRPLSNSPVIMTVPTNFHGQQNVIIGENLYDFLCLGCRAGYSVLEEFSWSNGQLEPIRSNQYADYLDQQQINLIEILNQELSLEPWSSLEDKIISLNSTYLSHLIY
ncbi:hypothetical protein H6F67_09380 [Microcoleus sp. FACHB-1515]|uniref:hypothetical protein n=1 Tax=Cyanophyceae TaxID=3028117 RepID=UPI00168392C2|nr:hypothetical protein [Microcoleus sp. FACHB-1515]MBD2090063.1 hypothetical protein [Microcoleus sp. FACHB-1515]